MTNIEINGKEKSHSPASWMSYGVCVWVSGRGMARKWPWIFTKSQCAKLKKMKKPANATRMYNVDYNLNTPCLTLLGLLWAVYFEYFFCGKLTMLQQDWTWLFLTSEQQIRMESFYKHGLIETRACISNHMHYFMCDVVTNLYLDLTGGIAKCHWS